MASRRTIILMGILLASLGGYLAIPFVQSSPLYQGPGASVKPLPGQNSISNLKLEKRPDLYWTLSFDYFSTGDPQLLLLRLRQVDSRDGSAQAAVTTDATLGTAQRGAHRYQTVIVRPRDESLRFTTEFVAQMYTPADTKVLVSEKASPRIEWPSHAFIDFEHQVFGKTPEQLVDRAIALIDAGDLSRANQILDRVIEMNPKMDTAYIELARVRMKSNWGPEGLQQAASVLETAIGIRDSADARILQAYVFAYQKKFKESEALLVQASKTDTKNLWLWTNWGELMELQGKPEAAIARYRETVAHPATHDKNDRARSFAYRKLIPMLEARKDYDGALAMHKQQAEEYGYGPCSGAAYAIALLRFRGDATGAIEVARKAGEARCPINDVREITGVAHYVAWAASTDPQRAESLNKARAFMPAGARLFYQLAASDRLAEVAKRLVATGDRIDAQDNYKLTALAYALRNKDLETARRLVRLGAKTDALVGDEQMPVALIPVAVRDLDGVRLMQRYGIDYAKLRYQGLTAIDHAKQSGDKVLQRALEPKAGSI
ncbi:MAG TPA: hypothetical protein VK996_05585 [Ramlibacter sp.]|nr:hypothetical protein [Ramlibacter sp.]